MLQVRQKLKNYLENEEETEFKNDHRLKFILRALLRYLPESEVSVKVDPDIASVTVFSGYRADRFFTYPGNLWLLWRGTDGELNISKSEEESLSIIKRFTEEWKSL